MGKRKTRETLLRVLDVKKSFRLDREDESGRFQTESLEVLKGVTLDIGKGEAVAVVGASGAGKSTLLHILGTLDTPTAGKVYYQGDDVFSLDGQALASFRNRNIGFIFQFHHLLPEFTALENVAMPAMIEGAGLREARHRALEVLDRVGISDRKDSKPAQLSGGEQQRVAVARALVNSPMVVLADEPTGNLDTVNAGSIHELIEDLARENDQTFVIVTHNEKLAKQADRVIRIADGIVETNRRRTTTRRR